MAQARHGLEDDPSIAFKRATTRRATSGRMFLTAAFTGLRASELRALRWRSVDFAGSLLHVERGFTDEGGEDLPKSYRVRSVPLMPQVALALSRLRTRELFTDDDELVFPSAIGQPLNYDRLSRRYRAAQRRPGLRPLRFHDLRHGPGGHRRLRRRSPSGSARLAGIGPGALSPHAAAVSGGAHARGVRPAADGDGLAGRGRPVSGAVRREPDQP
jgi:integrase